MSEGDPARIHAAIREALTRGDKIKAIKLMRAASGLGLKEAMDRVERLAATDHAVDATDDDDERDEPAHTSLEAPRTLPAAAMSALQQGHKIEAIKLTREHYGLGLKEAKDLVDSQQVTLIGDRDVPPYQVTSSGGWWRLGLFLAAAVLGYFWLFGHGQ